jgi:hypothetical protein
VGVGGVVGHQHLGHASDLGSGFGHATDVLASDQHVDITTDLGGGGNGVQGGRAYGTVSCSAITRIVI